MKQGWIIDNFEQVSKELRRLSKRKKDEKDGNNSQDHRKQQGSDLGRAG